MTIWSRLGQLFTQATQVSVQALNNVVERIHTVFAGDPETRRHVAFSVAMIALSAKMAKADGVVSDAEIKAFYEIFAVPSKDARHVEYLYNLAKQDIAGFDHYARRLHALCCETGCDGSMLEDVIDGLFHIAKADGVIHQDELQFLQQVAEIFAFSKARFQALAARHMETGLTDPWQILGLERGVGYHEARKRYHDLVRENHPDHVIARGLPKEFLAIANARLGAINDAWAMVKGEFVSA